MKPEDWLVIENPNGTRTFLSKKRLERKWMRKGMSGRQWVKLRKALQRHHRKNGPVDTTPTLIAAPVVEQ